MRGARIYVDFDDVLSDTVHGLLQILDDLHGRSLAVEEVRHFDLGRSFGLDAAELAAFMDEAHRPERLEALAPREGAVATLRRWVGAGYEVAVMTGRPPETDAASRRWLSRYEVPHAVLHSVDKYARHADHPDSLSLEALAGMPFALAVEDSLEMAAHLAGALGLRVALMDRPWNREVDALAPEVRARITRVADWNDVAARFASPGAR